ncbi:hypothetical protein EDD21DRAFT_226919 [Dissophora ornata]|nr:hypothetical protein EDD21DRAFT_226919 [Dissophora ornata]
MLVIAFQNQRIDIDICVYAFYRTTARPVQHRESPVPPVEILQEVSLADVQSEEELLAHGATKSTVPIFSDRVAEEGGPSLAIDAEDADDEQTGYDSLDDAASFFTAATGMATQTETPTRDAFFISPLDRSARVVEWHQEQQTLHHAKGAATVTSSQVTAEQVPWAFAAGVSQGEQALTSGASNKAQNRQSMQSGASVGIIPTGATQSVFCPTIILDTLQKDPTLAKHLAFALLSGQKVCIMGQSENESKVRALVSVLATFLPHAGYPSREEQLIEHQRQIVTWHPGHGLLQVEEMEKLCLVGVDSSKIDPKFLESDICIVDYDTFTWINGRQYTDGVFLESIFRNMSIFSEDASFLAFVDGKIFDILLKAFLYYHLVFHGKLYLGGLLAHSGAQAFYSSGASDDGEAFSYQHNFRSSRQSPSSPMSIGIARLSRRDTSAYPSSTQLGTTALYKNSSPRSVSLSSQESSDVEKSMMEQRDLRRALKYQQIEDARRQQYERIGHDRLVMSGDESSQRGGPMQYTTSQGMRKWKKWFEYWSAKSVAMIDPALAAFGRSDSAGAVDGTSGSGTRRKRNNSRRSSPQRRPRNSPSHYTIPSRYREAKEREKGRDRERERERNRKSAFDNFDTLSEKLVMSNSSESESNRNHDDMAAFEREVVMDEKSRMKYMGSRSDGEEGMGVESRIDESHANLVEALAPLSKHSGGLRRLKPKRPLLLQRVASKLSDVEHEKHGHDDGAISTNGEALKRNSSPGSAGSPPQSATFRSLAGAIRAMSLGHPSSSTTAVDAAGHLDAPSKGLALQSSETQHSPRNSRELSDSNHANKEVKRRGSTRAKAKAWLKSKRKKRSRMYEGEQFGQKPLDVGENEEDLSEEEQESDPDVQDQGQEQSQPQSQLPQEVEDSELTVRAAPKSAAKVPLTIQEIASQEPTKSVSRVVVPTSAISSGNSSSRVSSAAPSRITSPTLLSFSAGHRQRTDPTSGTISLSKASSSLASAALLDSRSEIDDSEYDPRRDPGRESATEYETSLETFAGMDSSNLSSFGSGALISGGRPSLDSSTGNSLDAGTAGASSKTLQPIPQSQLDQDQKETEKQQSDKDKTAVTLTEEEEVVVREMLGGVIGSNDWSIIVHLATIVDEYERSKEPAAQASNEP